jgi:hypothetical protein
MMPTSFQSDPIFHSPLYDQRNADGSDADMMSLQNPQWARWFDQLKAMNGGRMPSLKGAPGLPDDDHYGTIPVSLQNIPGASYGYDDFGAPVSMNAGGRKAETPEMQAGLRQAAQPKPWSLGGGWRSMDFAPLPDPSARRSSK